MTLGAPVHPLHQIAPGGSLERLDHRRGAQFQVLQRRLIGVSVNAGLDMAGADAGALDEPGMSSADNLGRADLSELSWTRMVGTTGPASPPLRISAWRAKNLRRQ